MNMHTIIHTYIHAYFPMREFVRFKPTNKFRYNHGSANYLKSQTNIELGNNVMFF